VRAALRWVLIQALTATWMGADPGGTVWTRIGSELRRAAWLELAVS